jgi:hypothetical protein
LSFSSAFTAIPNDLLPFTAVYASGEVVSFFVPASWLIAHPQSAITTVSFFRSSPFSLYHLCDLGAAWSISWVNLGTPALLAI